MEHNRLMTIFNGRSYIQKDGNKNEYENNLLERLQEMRIVRDQLRCQINLERNLLEREKMEIGNATRSEQAVCAKTMGSWDYHHPAATPKRSTGVYYNRGDLEDIEQQCGQQLSKLESYIESVKYLKTNLRNLQSMQEVRESCVGENRRSLPVMRP